MTLDIQYARSGAFRSPTRWSATGRSTSSSCPTTSRTSSTAGRCAATGASTSGSPSLSADPLRQARHGPLGSRRAVPGARDADGRRARGPRRGRARRARSSSASRRLLDGGAVRSDVSRSGRGRSSSSTRSRTSRMQTARRAAPSSRSSGTVGRRRRSATSCCPKTPRRRCTTIRTSASRSRTGFGWARSPAVAYALNRAWRETDLREMLPAVRVPTLVLYRAGYSKGSRSM